MKRTIFSQFMSMCIIVVFICTVLMSTFSYLFVRNHLVSKQAEDMEETANFLVKVISEFLNVYDADIESFYDLNVNVLADQTNSFIFLTDTSGNIVLKSDNAGLRVKKVDISGFGEIEKGSNQMKRGAFDDVFGEKTVTQSSPVIYEGRMLGAVFVSTPIDYVYKNGEVMLWGFVMMSLIAIFVSMIASFVLSRRITKPVKKLGFAAREIAKGSFGKRVMLKSGIVEMNELEQAFNSMAHALENQISRRTDFISNISHDLRTPMTTICGFVEAVLDGTVTEEERDRYLKIVLSETKRLSELIKKLLDVSKYGETSTVIEKNEFDLNETIRTVILSLEQKITDKNLHVEFLLDSDESYVYASKDEIHRVVHNLIDNAVKFSDTGGNIKIVLKHSGQKIVTEISNSGSEISEEEKKFIWDRFYKADTSRTDKDSGFGLGLYIVKSIINRHKEDISVTSKDGITIFKFTLPAA